MRRSDRNDIKAPDGYVLGGLRRVRSDGTILFQRGWWKLPDDVIDLFALEDVWVHEVVIERGEEACIEVASPGLHIYEAQGMRPPHTVFAHRTDRPDAKPGVRLQWRKDYISRTAIDPVKAPKP